MPGSDRSRLADLHSQLSNQQQRVARELEAASGQQLKNRMYAGTASDAGTTSVSPAHDEGRSTPQTEQPQRLLFRSVGVDQCE
jgi:hypothetical protein